MGIVKWNAAETEVVKVYGTRLMELDNFEPGVTGSMSAEGAAEGSQWRARFGAATGTNMSTLLALKGR